MLYMVTFTINIPQMLVYIPYMDPMGIRFFWRRYQGPSSISTGVNQLQGRKIPPIWRRYCQLGDIGRQETVLFTCEERTNHGESDTSIYQ